MKKAVYLLNLKISGIKNIEKEIELEFYKKTISRNFNPDNYRVKAIYGENGSGKTAIVTAVQILKNLMCDQFYLSESSNQKLLHEIINKRTETFRIEAEFKGNIKRIDSIYKYCIELSKDETDKYVISHEALHVKSANYASANYSAVYECENGELTKVITPGILPELTKITANLLDTRSLLCAVISRVSEMPQFLEEKRFMLPVIAGMVFPLALRTSLEESDQHDLYFMEQTAYESDDDEQVINEIFPQILNALNSRQHHSDKLVKKSDFNEYKQTIKQMEMFIKCFKRDLVGIEIDKKEDHEYYVCKLIMKYKGYKVDVEFESTGLKKLMRLFEYIQFSAQGGVVFIDEMDSNINDVYLCKLIEYFMRYGEGQLCFTTHNTSPMAVLREGKNAIDFLSNDGQVVSWKKNGNFSPESLYRNGMIEYLPFNVEAEDFIGILGN